MSHSSHNVSGYNFPFDPVKDLNEATRQPRSSTKSEETVTFGETKKQRTLPPLDLSIAGFPGPSFPANPRGSALFASAPKVTEIPSSASNWRTCRPQITRRTTLIPSRNYPSHKSAPHGGETQPTFVFFHPKSLKGKSVGVPMEDCLKKTGLIDPWGTPFKALVESGIDCITVAFKWIGYTSLDWRIPICIRAWRRWIPREELANILAQNFKTFIKVLKTHPYTLIDPGWRIEKHVFDKLLLCSMHQVDGDGNLWQVNVKIPESSQ